MTPLCPDACGVVRILQALADVSPEKRMDTLAVAIKCYIEAGLHWSALGRFWFRLSGESGGE